jgi:MSHA pilin protein MshD
MRADSNRRRQSGFTLIELVIAIVITSVGAVGLLTLVLQTTGQSADPLLRQQAHAIARSYLDEVLLKSFCDPDLSTDCPTDCSVANICANAACATSEGSRALYDDICHYDTLNDAGAVDQNGTAIVGLESYNVSITVDDNASSLNGLLSSAGQVLRVDVVVKHPGLKGGSISLSGYRANY